MPLSDTDTKVCAGLAAPPMTDAEYEAMTLDYWATRAPGADDVMVIVRSRGKFRLAVRLEPGAESVTLTPETFASSVQPPA